MADVSVRRARTEDVAEIGRIQIDTWRTAYSSFVPEAVLDSLRVEDAAATWEQAITDAPSPHHRVLVAQEQDWLVGFVAFGPTDDLEGQDPEPDTTIGIGPLLVEPRWGRRGHGSRLLAATVDLAREDGMTRAITWIPEEDQPSREFLIAAGWAQDGLARALDTGSGELREIRLHVSLAP